MSAGLFALLDDVATLAKAAAASVDDIGAAAGRASAKAAGVVVDDTAVTPQYVQGVSPKRELPIIKRIAIGSLRNKLLIILPAALLLSQFLPWLLTPILMCGGAFLCYEGAEKILHALKREEKHVDEVLERGEDAEKKMVSDAIRTDLILSAEIMVIALNEVADQSFWARAAILIVVAVAITILVYGVVALIVKMDDIGLHLTKRSSTFVQRVGHGMVAAMPKLLGFISIVGTAAMLWVGGHILLVGLDDLGWHGPYSVVHHLEEQVHHAVAGIGAALGWLVNTAFSALAGLVVGFVIVGVMHLIPRRKHQDEHTSTDETAGTEQSPHRPARQSGPQANQQTGPQANQQTSQQTNHQTSTQTGSQTGPRPPRDGGEDSAPPTTAS